MGGAAPFQIDGNLGAPAAMIESLLQSHENVMPPKGNSSVPQAAYTGDEGKIPLVRLLPSLPEAWSAKGGGSAKGLRARGGYVVDLSWDSVGTLRTASLTSEAGKPIYVTLGRAQVGGDNEGTAIQVDSAVASGVFIRLDGTKDSVYNITLA